MPELGTFGSVRGALSNERPYRDPHFLKQAKACGDVVSGSGKVPEDWPAEAKLAVVIETASQSEAERSQYCRAKGLYPEQVRAWRQACITGQQSATALKQTEREQARADKKRIRELERELNRKERALAEAAALLVLRKKLNALWGDDNGDSCPRSRSGNNSSDGSVKRPRPGCARRAPAPRRGCRCARCSAGRRRMT
jgi:transposase-like protein